MTEKTHMAAEDLKGYHKSYHLHRHFATCHL
jgi:hypothetical protein